MDSYICKCREGYILDVNNITCNKIIASDYADSEEFDEDNDNDELV